LYLTDDAFADVVNSLYALGYITVSNAPTPFPRVTGVPQILHGDGAPEGVVFGPQGSLFMRRDNSGADNALFAKTTGPSLNTGWQAFSTAAAPTPSTTLPASPSNGQQAILVDSTSAPTYAWFLEYSTTAAKWIFIGGSPAIAEVTTPESTTSTTYTALTTAGPSFTVPRAGDYYVTIGALMTAPGNIGAYMSYDIGGTGAVDADRVEVDAPSASGRASVSRTRMKSGLAASTALVAKYKTTSGTPTFENRFMTVVPRTVT